MKRIVAAAATAVLVLAGPAPAVASDRGPHLRAKIERASYGVPHITADSFASLGFGVAYVQAEDNVCVIAERVLTVDAQRSRYLGGTGPADANVRSDLFHQKAKDDRIAERWLDGRPDGLHAPTRNARDLVRGFVAGYNAYLRRVGVTGISDPTRPGCSPARAGTPSSTRGRSSPPTRTCVRTTCPSGRASVQVDRVECRPLRGAARRPVEMRRHRPHDTTLR